MVRDPAFVKSQLKQVGDALMTMAQARIVVPQHYISKPLLIIGETVSVIGVHGILIGNKYSVNKTNAMFTIKPDYTNIIKYDEEPYYEFVFEAGSNLYENINVVKSDDNPYNIFDEIIDRGYVPWYLDYNDVGSLLESSKKYTGTTYGATPTIFSVLASHMARQHKDKYKYHRHMLKNQEDVQKIRPAFVGFGNVLYGPSNVTTALMGNYFRDATTVALLKPSTREEPIENVLTS